MNDRRSAYDLFGGGGQFGSKQGEFLTEAFGVGVAVLDCRPSLLLDQFHDL